ncbi:MAG: SRPBCC family protein [Bacteroidota bacterium]|nr:SRPBCC family protein [Bacteroidota bacterium]
MKLFTVFVAILGFFALVFIVSLFFPHQYRIEKSTLINKPVSSTFGYMNNIKNWSDWSPWNTSIDSSMVSFYSPTASGAGSTHYFRGGLVGSGRFKITESIPNQKIHYDLSINEGLMHSEATFYFKSVNDGTQLFWVDSGDVGLNPLFRYLLPSKISETEHNFEDGLKAIKLAAETKL